MTFCKNTVKIRKRHVPGRAGLKKSGIKERRIEMEGIEKVYQFLDEAQTYYLATVEGDQPRVRPFGTALLRDGKLYIQTGKVPYGVPSQHTR